MAELADVYSRRQVLGALAAAGAGMLGACAPVAHFAVPGARLAAVDAVLHAFVETVVPGAGSSPSLIRPFADPFYSFAEWRDWFTGDLCRRSTRLARTTFDNLSLEDRTRIVSAGLGSDLFSRRIYAGAVFLAQISAYVPLYEAQGHSPLLRFEGVHRFRGLAAVTYEDPQHYLGAALTCDGNWT